jgi:surfactin family lipopeptide synthetase A
MKTDFPIAENRHDIIQGLLDGTFRLGSLEPALVAGISGDSPAPLSPWQMHVWKQAQLAARLSPGIQLFNETVTIHRHGSLDIAAFEKSWSEILRRQQAWRTSFRVVNGQPMQFVNPMTENSLPLSDLRGLSPIEREREAVRLGNEDAQRLFDLEEGPLVRARLVRLGENEWRLLLTVHQILIDGVSAYQVFLSELVALYKAFSEGQVSVLPPPAVQYSDYAAWQAERKDTYAAQLAYWRKELAHLPGLRLTTDRPRPPQQTFRGAILPFALPKSVSDALRQYSLSEGTTLFTVLLAVFYSLLHRYTRQVDLVLGTVAPTRRRSEVQGLLGNFVNPVVLRADLSGDPSFREVLVRSRRIFLGAMSNCDVPFDSVVDAVTPQPGLDRFPLYQVQISLEPPLPVLDEGWNLTPMDFESGGAKLDLYLIFDDRPNGIIGRVQYNPDLFDAVRMRRMVEDYQAVLEAVLADPGRRLSELPSFRLQ